MAQQSTAHQASVTVPGAANGAAANTTERRALYLKLFSGEMFKGFQHNAIARAVSYTHLTLPTICSV